MNVEFKVTLKVSLESLNAFDEAIKVLANKPLESSIDLAEVRKIGKFMFYPPPPDDSGEVKSRDAMLYGDPIKHTDSMIKYLAHYNARLLKVIKHTNRRFSCIIRHDKYAEFGSKNFSFDLWRVL